MDRSKLVYGRVNISYLGVKELEISIFFHQNPFSTKMDSSKIDGRVHLIHMGGDVSVLNPLFDIMGCFTHKGNQVFFKTGRVNYSKSSCG